MLVTDPVDQPWVDLHAAFLHWGAPLVCAVAVVLTGKWLAARKVAALAAPEAAIPAAARAVTAGAPGHLQRVLLAVDGSDGASRATKHLINLRQDLRQPSELAVHVVNVQRPVPGDVSQFVPGKTLEDYHRENSEEAFAPARELLGAAQVAYKEHRRAGDPGPTIASVARAEACDLIVMGTRGLGSQAAALIGSVASSTVEHSTVPVLLVK
jgi:nucleotide-binding universal stress UspA family protein